MTHTVGPVSQLFPIGPKCPVTCLDDARELSNKPESERFKSSEKVHTAAVLVASDALATVADPAFTKALKAGARAWQSGAPAYNSGVVRSQSAPGDGGPGSKTHEAESFLLNI